MIMVKNMPLGIWIIFNTKATISKVAALNVLEEATIIATGGNSAETFWDDSHTGLIDNEGLAGTSDDVHSKKCGVSQSTTGKKAFLSMKLDAPKTILKLRLATRTDGYATTQAKNVRVQVGTSSQYNANDPVCTDIPQLSGPGLVDYYCDQLYEGLYVILSTDQTYITICEAKIFIDTSDYIEMRDGNSEDSQLMGKFCGNHNNVPAFMTTTQNHMTIRWKDKPKKSLWLLIIFL